MDISSDTTDLTTDGPVSGFEPLGVGVPVNVDEGDSFGCREYTGNVEEIGEDGRLKIRLKDGTCRWAYRHQVDPA